MDLVVMEGQESISDCNLTDHSFISSEMGRNLARETHLYFEVRDFPEFFFTAAPFRSWENYTGITAGPSGGISSFASVRDWTCSTVAPGAISRRKRPCRVTSMKANSVTI
jgi:hypothetical protein